MPIKHRDFFFPKKNKYKDIFCEAERLFWIVIMEILQSYP